MNSEGDKVKYENLCIYRQCPQSFSFGFNEEDESCINLKKARREQIRSLIENKGALRISYPGWQSGRICMQPKLCWD